MVMARGYILVLRSPDPGHHVYCVIEYTEGEMEELGKESYWHLQVIDLICLITDCLQQV